MKLLLFDDDWLGRLWFALFWRVEIVVPNVPVPRVLCEQPSVRLELGATELVNGDAPSQQHKEAYRCRNDARGWYLWNAGYPAL